MISTVKHILFGMAIGSVVTAMLLCAIAAPHLKWSLEAGNQSEAVNQATQAVALAEMMPPPPARKPKEK